MMRRTPGAAGTDPTAGAAGGDVRVGKVESIRAQIDAGTYADDDHKLDIAADRMLDDLTKLGDGRDAR